jgi:hypothetical protein
MQEGGRKDLVPASPYGTHRAQHPDDGEDGKREAQTRGRVKTEAHTDGRRLRDRETEKERPRKRDRKGKEEKERGGGGEREGEKKGDKDTVIKTEKERDGQTDSWTDRREREGRERGGEGGAYPGGVVDEAAAVDQDACRPLDRHRAAVVGLCGNYAKHVMNIIIISSSSSSSRRIQQMFTNSMFDAVRLRIRYGTRPSPTRRMMKHTRRGRLRNRHQHHHHQHHHHHHRHHDHHHQQQPPTVTASVKIHPCSSSSAPRQ